MMKLLIVGRIQKPIPQDTDAGLDSLSKQLKNFGDVYTLYGLEGFVAIVEVDNFERLDSIFLVSEFSKFGKIEIFPLAKN